MATADVSGIAYFAPIAAFLIVALICYAILAKTKVIGENKFLNLFISLVIATLFISVAGARVYLQTVTPWIAVLLVSLVFLLAITGLIGKPAEFMQKGISVSIIIVFGLIFLVSALFVFSHFFIQYLPGPGFGAGDPKTTYILSWLYSPQIAGAILLIIISAAVSWVLVKSK